MKAWRNADGKLHRYYGPALSYLDSLSVDTIHRWVYNGQVIK